jgi:LPXTG-site transpeptidase (sortase) family protein
MKKLLIITIVFLFVLPTISIGPKEAIAEAVEQTKEQVHNEIPNEIPNIEKIENIEKIVQVETDPSPARLIIPSINLDSPIQHVGLNSKGEMDVPSGRTNNVGWYKDGTVPGQTGSAVIDAHVFAAFVNLNQLKPGNEIRVINRDGSKLRFVVYATNTYPIAEVPLNDLFNKQGDAFLNLITCAGKLTSDRSTYDHRLIVYAKLITGPSS